MSNYFSVNIRRENKYYNGKQGISTVSLANPNTHAKRCSNPKHDTSLQLPMSPELERRYIECLPMQGSSKTPIPSVLKHWIEGIRIPICDLLYQQQQLVAQREHFVLQSLDAVYNKLLDARGMVLEHLPENHAFLELLRTLRQNVETVQGLIKLSSAECCRLGNLQKENEVNTIVNRIDDSVMRENHQSSRGTRSIAMRQSPQLRKNNTIYFNDQFNGRHPQMFPSQGLGMAYNMYPPYMHQAITVNGFQKPNPSEYNLQKTPYTKSNVETSQRMRHGEYQEFQKLKRESTIRKLVRKSIEKHEYLQMKQKGSSHKHKPATSNAQELQNEYVQNSNRLKLNPKSKASAQKHKCSNYILRDKTKPRKNYFVPVIPSAKPIVQNNGNLSINITDDIYDDGYSVLPNIRRNHIERGMQKSSGQDKSSTSLKGNIQLQDNQMASHQYSKSLLSVSKPNASPKQRDASHTEQITQLVKNPTYIDIDAGGDTNLEQCKQDASELNIITLIDHGTFSISY